MPRNRIPMEMDHEYDGIREYDNPTPGWWHLIFIGTIVFSLVYVAFWHGSPLAWTPEQAWAEAKRVEDARMFGQLGELSPDRATILRMMGNPSAQAVAKGLFKANCAQCHGPDGGGLPASGVNLCDDHYKNVKQIEDLYAVITNGANNGAMPKHLDRLSEKERIVLAAFVAQLRGTKPEGAQPPAGEIIAPWPTLATKESK